MPVAGGVGRRSVIPVMAEKFARDGDISPSRRNNPVIPVTAEKLRPRQEAGRRPRAAALASAARIKASTRPLKIIRTRFQPAGLNRLPDTLRIHKFPPCRALGQHGRRHLDFGKERGQKVQGIQPTQGDQRPGIGDDDPN